MNGNDCIMSPNIDSRKDSSCIGALNGIAPSRNQESSPDARLILNAQPTEFSTPDHSVLASVPGKVKSSNDTNQCKIKYLSCSSSTPIKHVHQTPPSRNRSVVVTNPFDVGLTERLHLPICSPSVFSHSVNPVQESPTFRWNIDNLSKIYPVDIEEFPSEQYEETLDPELESRAQDAINRFFGKSQHLLPSPWGPRPDNDAALRAIINNSGTGTPQMHKTLITEKEEDLSQTQEKQPGKNAWTQTTLTLPPILPPSVELALKPFFTFTAEQQLSQNTSTDSSSDGDEGVLSTSSLRRKLLFNESPSSTSSSPKQAHMSVGCSSSSTSFSQSVIVTQGRTFGTPISGSNMLSPLALSPVNNSSPSVPRPKSVTRLSFNQEDMAVDVSLTTPCSPCRIPCEPAVSVCSSPLGTAPLNDKDTDEESNEANRLNNKWSRRNKRNLMDISSDSMHMSQNCTPVKSMETSMQNAVDISQSNQASRASGRQTNRENTFGYSHTIGMLQDTGYVSSCDGTASQSSATSMFGLSMSRDKMGYEDSLAIPWQINPHVVSSTPTKTSGAMPTNYQHD